MTDMNVGLVDLAAALLIAGAVIVRLKRGGGVLSAIGSGLATAVAVWIATVAVATWAPPPPRRTPPTVSSCTPCPSRITPSPRPSNCSA